MQCEAVKNQFLKILAVITGNLSNQESELSVVQSLTYRPLDAKLNRAPPFWPKLKGSVKTHQKDSTCQFSRPKTKEDKV